MMAPMKHKRKLGKVRILALRLTRDERSWVEREANRETDGSLTAFARRRLLVGYVPPNMTTDAAA